MRLLGWLSRKDSTCRECQCRWHEFDPWVRSVLWRRKWQLTPVFLTGKSQGQRNVAGYNPQDRKQSDATERLNNSMYLYASMRVHMYYIQFNRNNACIWLKTHELWNIKYGHIRAGVNLKIFWLEEIQLRQHHTWNSPSFTIWFFLCIILVQLCLCYLST